MSSNGDPSRGIYISDPLTVYEKGLEALHALVLYLISLADVDLHYQLLWSHVASSICSLQVYGALLLLQIIFKFTGDHLPTPSPLTCTLNARLNATALLQKESR